MRIVFDMLIAEQEHGSALLSTKHLLTKLALADQANEYIIMSGCPQEYRQEVTRPNIHLYPVKLHTWQHILIQHQFLTLKILRHIGPDIVHVPDSIAPIGWNGALVIAIHDLSFLDEQYQSSRLYAQLCWNYLLREGMRQAQRIITSSEHARREVLKRWPIEQERIAIIANKAHAVETLQIYREVLAQKELWR
jgi:hypothetical protein